VVPFRPDPQDVESGWFRQSRKKIQRVGQALGAASVKDAIFVSLANAIAKSAWKWTSMVHLTRLISGKTTHPQFRTCFSQILQDSKSCLHRRTFPTRGYQRNKPQSYLILSIPPKLLFPDSKYRFPAFGITLGLGQRKSSDAASVKASLSLQGVQ